MRTETYIAAVVPSTPGMGPRQASVHRSHLALIDAWFEQYCRVPDTLVEVLDRESKYVPPLQIGDQWLSPREVLVYKKYLIDHLRNARLPL